VGRSQGAGLLKIGEVARRSRLTRQTLHNYVVMGLIRPGGRSAGGQRLFGEDVFVRLEMIERLKKRGYTLRDMREIFLKERR